MKKLIYPMAALALLAASAFTVVKSQDWKINDTYSIKFDGGDPSGEFKGLKGTVKFDPADLPGSKFDASIDVASINTGNGMKNTHAKSEKWFDADKYPLIKFTSSSITKTATGYAAAGTLEMHGVQKPATIPFTLVSTLLRWIRRGIVQEAHGQWGDDGFWGSSPRGRTVGGHSCRPKRLTHGRSRKRWTGSILSTSRATIRWRKRWPRRVPGT